MSLLAALPGRYSTILCDVWGVIHDGVRLYPGVAARLRQWREEGRFVILLTNAPRPAESVAAQLARIGLSVDCWDRIATSGEAGIAALLELDQPVGFIGSPGDRAIFEQREISLVDSGFRHLAAAGMDGIRMRVADYEEELAAAAAARVTMHCLNPDRVVHRGGIPEPCAGALADRYLELGGRVEYYGKPHDHIYEHALSLAGDPPRAQVLAIGDALATDILGAARFGLDAVFVQGGIHAGEPFPADFAARYGLGEWAPVAVVPALG